MIIKSLDTNDIENASSVELLRQPEPTTSEALRPHGVLQAQNRRLRAALQAQADQLVQFKAWYQRVMGEASSSLPKPTTATTRNRTAPGNNEIIQTLSPQIQNLTMTSPPTDHAVVSALAALDAVQPLATTIATVAGRSGLEPLLDFDPKQVKRSIQEYLLQVTKQSCGSPLPHPWDPSLLLGAGSEHKIGREASSDQFLTSECRDGWGVAKVVMVALRASLVREVTAAVYGAALMRYAAIKDTMYAEADRKVNEYTEQLHLVRVAASVAEEELVKLRQNVQSLDNERRDLRQLATKLSIELQTTEEIRLKAALGSGRFAAEHPTVINDMLSDRAHDNISKIGLEVDDPSYQSPVPTSLLNLPFSPVPPEHPAMGSPACSITQSRVVTEMHPVRPKQKESSFGTHITRDGIEPTPASGVTVNSANATLLNSDLITRPRSPPITETAKLCSAEMASNQPRRLQQPIVRKEGGTIYVRLPRNWQAPVVSASDGERFRIPYDATGTTQTRSMGIGLENRDPIPDQISRHVPAIKPPVPPGAPTISHHSSKKSVSNAFTGHCPKPLLSQTDSNLPDQAILPPTHYPATSIKGEDDAHFGAREDAASNLCSTVRTNLIIHPRSEASTDKSSLPIPSKQALIDKALSRAVSQGQHVVRVDVVRHGKKMWLRKLVKKSRTSTAPTILPSLIPMIGSEPLDDRQDDNNLTSVVQSVLPPSHGLNLIHDEMVTQTQDVDLMRSIPRETKSVRIENQRIPQAVDVESTPLQSDEIGCAGEENIYHSKEPLTSTEGVSPHESETHWKIQDCSIASKTPPSIQPGHPSPSITPTLEKTPALAPCPSPKAQQEAVKESHEDKSVLPKTEISEGNAPYEHSLMGGEGGDGLQIRTNKDLLLLQTKEGRAYSSFQGLNDAPRDSEVKRAVIPTPSQQSLQRCLEKREHQPESLKKPQPANQHVQGILPPHDPSHTKVLSQKWERLQKSRMTSPLRSSKEPSSDNILRSPTERVSYTSSAPPPSTTKALGLGATTMQECHKPANPEIPLVDSSISSIFPTSANAKTPNPAQKPNQHIDELDSRATDTTPAQPSPAPPSTRLLSPESEEAGTVTTRDAASSCTTSSLFPQIPGSPVRSRKPNHTSRAGRMQESISDDTSGTSPTEHLERPDITSSTQAFKIVHPPHSLPSISNMALQDGGMTTKTSSPALSPRNRLPVTPLSLLFPALFTQPTPLHLPIQSTSPRGLSTTRPSSTGNSPDPVHPPDPFQPLSSQLSSTTSPGFSSSSLPTPSTLPTSQPPSPSLHDTEAQGRQHSEEQQISRPTQMKINRLPQSLDIPQRKSRKRRKKPNNTLQRYRQSLPSISEDETDVSIGDDLTDYEASTTLEDSFCRSTVSDNGDLPVSTELQPE